MEHNAGPNEPKKVPLRVLERKGTLAFVEGTKGDRAWLVLCPHCDSDLSKVSLGRLLDLPIGVVPDVLHPVRCPDCGGALLPAPLSAIARVPPGAKLS